MNLLYKSTRSADKTVTASEAILKGLADDGGLFVPALTYDAMNTIVEGKVVLGRVYNPMTLELLEEIRAPYEKNLMILMRGNINRIIPGDFTFMIGDLDSEIR